MASKLVPTAGAHTAGIFADMTVDGPEIGTLVIIFDRAKNLPNRKSMGKQNPYCAARLGKEAKKTEVDQRGGQTPRWDQEIRFTVHDSPDYNNLKISVFSEDKKTELIGEAWVALDSVIVPGGGKRDLWQGLSCKGKYAGELRVEMTYYDNRPKPDGTKEQLPAQDELRQSVGGGSRVKRRPLPSNPNASSVTPDTIPPVAVPRRAQHGPRDYRMPPRATSLPPEQASSSHTQTGPASTEESFGSSQWQMDASQQQYDHAEYDSPSHPQTLYENQHAQNFLPQLPYNPRSQTQQRTPQHIPPPQTRPVYREPEALGYGRVDEAAVDTYPRTHELVGDYVENYPHDYQEPDQWHKGSGLRNHEELEDFDAHVPPPPPIHSNSAPVIPMVASPVEISQPIPQSRHYSNPSPFVLPVTMQPSRAEQYSIPSQASFDRLPAPHQRHVTPTDPDAYAISSGPTQIYEPSPQRGYSDRRQQYQHQQQQHQPNHHISQQRHQQPQHHAQHHSQHHAQQYQHQHQQPLPPREQSLQRQQNGGAALQQQQQHHWPQHMTDLQNDTVPPRQHYTAQQIAHPRPPHTVGLPMHEQADHYDHEPAPIVQPQPISPANQQSSRQPRSAYSIQHPVRSFESSDVSPLANNSQGPKRKSVSPRPSMSDETVPGVPFGPDSFNVHNPHSRGPAVPNGASPHSPYQIRPGSEQREEASGPIVGWHGQEIDPSDHLPVDSWAPEPVTKTPAKTYGLGRDRDFGPRNAQGQANDPIRISRDTVINIRSHGTAASHTTHSPPTAGRNRLVKKNSPAETPLREHDNYNPTTIPRMQPKYHAQSNEQSADQYNTGYGVASGAPSHDGYGNPLVPPKVPIEPYEHPSDALSRDIASIDIGASRNRRSFVAPSPTAYVPVKSHRERHSVYY